MADPIVRAEGTRIVCLWPDLSLGMAFDNIRDHSEGLTAEVSVYTLDAQLVKNGHVHWAKLNLASTPARSQLAKHLATRVVKGKIDWFSLIEFGCTTTAQRVRNPEPIVDLSITSTTPDRVLLLNPFLPRYHTSVFFGDGDSGKSTLAVAFAIALAAQKALPITSCPNSQISTLYLDYETSAYDQSNAVYTLSKGLGLSSPPTVHYRRLARPLVDVMSQLRADVYALKVGFVVLDSLGPACGGAPESAEVILPVFNALRDLGPTVTRLVISHISKADTDRRRARPIGSVFIRNLARSCWEVRRAGESDTDALHIGLFHDKENQGSRHAPVGVTFTFDNTAHTTMISRYDIQSSPDLYQSLSVAQRIRSELASGTKTVKEISSSLDEPEWKIYQTLRRIKDARIIEGGRGRGMQSSWGLIETKHLI